MWRHEGGTCRRPAGVCANGKVQRSQVAHTVGVHVQFTSLRRRVLLPPLQPSLQGVEEHRRAWVWPTVRQQLQPGVDTWWPLGWGMLQCLGHLGVGSPRISLAGGGH